MNEIISVIMSTYNETQKELNESINSILNQTYRNIEFIIVNDNPRNNSITKILQNYQQKDTRIKIIQNKSNLGLAQSLNKALSLAKGKYIVRMDADDISVNNRLELQYIYMQENPKCALVCTNRKDIDENSDLIGTETNFLFNDEDIGKILPFGSVIIHPTVMIRKEVYDEMKGYRNLSAGQDYDLWLRMLTSKYRMHIMPEKLLLYRIRKNSISNINFAKQYYSAMYAIKCYQYRIKHNNQDCHSDDELKKFMCQHRMNNEKYVNKLNTLYHDIHMWKKVKNFYNMPLLLLRIIICPQIVGVILRGTRYKKMIRKYQIVGEKNSV